MKYTGYLSSSLNLIAFFTLLVCQLSSPLLAQRKSNQRKPTALPAFLALHPVKPSQIDFDSKYLTAEISQKIRSGELCSSIEKEGQATGRVLNKFVELYFEQNDRKFEFLWAKYQKDKLLKGDKLFEEIADAGNPIQLAYLKRTIKHLENEYNIFGSTTEKASETVLIGDSLMEYFIDFQKRFTGKVVWLEKSYNAGIAGDTLDSLIARAPINIALHNPKNLVISIGGNNVIRGCMLDKSWNQEGEKVLEKLRLFIQNLKLALPNAKIYFFTLPPTGLKFTKETILAYNQRLKALCNELGITILDQYRYLADFNDNKFDHYFSSSADPIHLNELAYQMVWVSLMSLYFDVSAP